MKMPVLLACASPIALLVASPAVAQVGAPDAPTTSEAPGAIPDPAEASDEIVVTASSGERSRFRSSISVTQLSNEAITNFTPRSEAEVLRNIPGRLWSRRAGRPACACRAASS